jgi:hypothetical protein
LGFQPRLPGVPSQFYQVAPFSIMIMTLLLVIIGNTACTGLVVGASTTPGSSLLRAI